MVLCGIFSDNLSMRKRGLNAHAYRKQPCLLYNVHVIMSRRVFVCFFLFCFFFIFFFAIAS